MLTLELCLPLIVIVGCLLIGLVIDLKNGDKLFRQDYQGRHGRKKWRTWVKQSRLWLVHGLVTAPWLAVTMVPLHCFSSMHWLHLTRLNRIKAKRARLPHTVAPKQNKVSRRIIPQWIRVKLKTSINWRSIWKKTVLGDYQVTVNDEETLRHYFKSSDKLDSYFCEMMGWKHEWAY